MFFERSNDDLKDALDVLALADRSRDVLEQVQPRQLRLQILLRARKPAARKARIFYIAACFFHWHVCVFARAAYI